MVLKHADWIQHIATELLPNTRIPVSKGPTTIHVLASYSPMGGIVKDSSTRSATGLKMDYISN